MHNDNYYNSASVLTTFTQGTEESCSVYYARVRAFQTDGVRATPYPFRFRRSDSGTSSDSSTLSFVGQITSCQPEKISRHQFSEAPCFADNNSDIRLADKRVFLSSKLPASGCQNVPCSLNTDLSPSSRQVNPCQTRVDEPFIDASGEKSFFGRFTSALSWLFTSCCQTVRT